MNKTKRKKQQRMEEQDAQGISRKTFNHSISLEFFIAVKILCIASIPILYFVYSPLLIVSVLAYVFLFFISILAERKINKSVIKSNHIKIFKLDSAVALLIIIISLFGVCIGGTNKVKSGNFENMEQTE